MNKKEFHEKKFDDNTLCKLSIYQCYLREWLPVFIHTPHVTKINIFDFFAGPGSDSCDNKGSPLIAIDEIQSALQKPNKKNLKITLFLNEANLQKYTQLQEHIKSLNIQTFDITISNKNFNEVFTNVLPIMEVDHSANFIFMDQFGIKEITQNIFEKVTTIPQTDFMFYHAASSVNRFRNIDSIWNKLPPISDELCVQMNACNAHQIITDAYYQWIPEEIRHSYFLAPFSFKRRGNVNGLVFGSAHPKGILKFLTVAWKHSISHSGNANFDIDKDGHTKSEPALDFFKELQSPHKQTCFKKELIKRFQDKKIHTNKEILLFTLKKGMLPQHAKEVIQDLIKESIIPKQKISISDEAWKAKEQLIQYHDYSSDSLNLN